MPFYKVPATAPVVTAVATGNGQLVTRSPSGYGAHSPADGNQATGDGSDRSNSSELAEMTEADREMELMRRDLEQRVQLSNQHGTSLRMEEHELTVNGKVPFTTSTLGSNHRRSNGVIEKELQEQLRREEELASTRRQFSNQAVSVDLAPPCSLTTLPPRPDTINNEEVVVSKYATPAEGRIVYEVLEHRKREMELRGRWKEMGYSVPEVQSENETPFTLPEPLPVSQNKPRIIDHRPDEVDAAQNRKSSCSDAPKVRPYEDPEVGSDRKLAYIPANETPIEREIRLSREREDALREARGLQPLGSDRQGRESRSVEITLTGESDGIVGYQSQSSADPNVKVSMKKLANSRLQLELMKEKERELALRSQGFIHTISEERAGEPVKYVEVISKHQTEATTPTAMPLRSPAGTSAGQGVQSESGARQVVEVRSPEVPVPVTPGGGRTRQGGGPTPEQISELQTVFGGLQNQQPMQLLRQKSSTTKPTAAERRILNELKEMQMREEELMSRRQTTTQPTSEAYDESSAHRSQSPF